MKHPTSLLALPATLLLLLLLTQRATASWTLLWRNPPTVNTTIELGTTAQACKPINHTKGQEFEWDPHGAGVWCISFYGDVRCANRVGYSCAEWNKVASVQLLGFDVAAGTAASSTSGGVAGAAVTANATRLPLFVTVTATPPAPPPRLPKGAEAGITLSAVLTLLILSILGAWLYFRRQAAKGGTAAGRGRPWFLGKGVKPVEMCSVPVYEVDGQNGRAEMVGEQGHGHGHGRGDAGLPVIKVDGY